MGVEVRLLLTACLTGFLVETACNLNHVLAASHFHHGFSREQNIANSFNSSVRTLPNGFNAIVVLLDIVAHRLDSQRAELVVLDGTGSKRSQHALSHTGIVVAIEIDDKLLCQVWDSQIIIQA